MSSNTPNSHHHHQKFDTLLFHQVNVGKGGPNMDIALQQAWEAEVHVVMVQEPWTMRRNGDFITKSHTGFDSFVPFGNTAARSRPRAITFVRKGLQAAQNSAFIIQPYVGLLFRADKWIDFCKRVSCPWPKWDLSPLTKLAALRPLNSGGRFQLRIPALAATG